jgi:heat shock protein HslJ
VVSTAAEVPMKLTATIVVTTLAIAACGPVSQDAPVTGSQMDERLRDRNFASVAVRDESSRLPEEVTVGFEQRADRGIVRWQGCNATGSEVVVTDERLRLQGGPTDSTTIGCPPEEEAADRWLSAFFGSDPFWELEDGRLVLTSGNGSAVVVLEPTDGEGGASG